MLNCLNKFPKNILQLLKKIQPAFIFHKFLCFDFRAEDGCEKGLSHCMYEA